MVAEGKRLTVTLVAGPEAASVPLLAETLSHMEVFASDQVSGIAPVLVRINIVLVGLGGCERCAAAVKPAVGVICSASGTSGEATCMITTEGEQPHESSTPFVVAVFHFCQDKLLALRTVKAALALVFSHGPKACQRF